MIFTLIILILLVVFLAFFVGKNLSSICSTFWFFKTYQNASGLMLVFIAFAAGILVALLCVLLFKFRSNSRNKSRAERSSGKPAKETLAPSPEKKEHHFGFGKSKVKAEKPAKAEVTEKKVPAERVVQRTSLARSSENAGKESINQ